MNSKLKEGGVYKCNKLHIHFKLTLFAFHDFSRIAHFETESLDSSTNLEK